MEKSINPWRILIKGLVLYLTFEVLFYFSDFNPASINIYHAAGLMRERFPFSTAPDAQDRALDVGILDTIFSSHIISLPKQQDEYRVIFIGDSGTWGATLPASQALSSQVNKLGLICRNKRVRAYNLGYPLPSAIKDVLILEQSLQYQPDLVVWSVTLLTLTARKVNENPLLDLNPEQLSFLNSKYPLRRGKTQPISFREKFAHKQMTLYRTLRFQSYGLIQLATGKDQIQDESTLMERALPADLTFVDLNPPTLEKKELTLNLVNIFHKVAGDIPVIVMNEPIVSYQNVPNSEVRYNSYYPRWVYDQYRGYMDSAADEYNWRYLDFWNMFSSDYFTDTPLHLNREGEELLAGALAPSILEVCSK